MAVAAKVVAAKVEVVTVGEGVAVVVEMVEVASAAAMEEVVWEVATAEDSVVVDSVVVKLAAVMEDEVATIEMARSAGVCTLNEFRLQMGIEAHSSMDELCKEPDLAAELKELYGSVDNVELYTGMLCEYNLANAGAMLPHTAHMCSIPLNIIAADAFFAGGTGDVPKWGLEYAEGATLSGLLDSVCGVKTAEGMSVFNVGALS